MYSRKLETKHIENISKSCTKKRRCGCIVPSDIAATKSYMEKHYSPHRHLRKYISGLTCQACLLSLGHRLYRTMKSTVSSSKQLAVNSSDLPGNRSKFEISTLVPTADATSISAALFSDLLASKHADTPISILSFPTQAELSRARVKQKQVALDTLHRSEERRVGKECRSRWSPYH